MVAPLLCPGCLGTGSGVYVKYVPSTSVRRTLGFSFQTAEGTGLRSSQSTGIAGRGKALPPTLDSHRRVSSIGSTSPDAWRNQVEGLVYVFRRAGYRLVSRHDLASD